MKPSTFTKFYLHALAVDHVDIYIALSDVFGHKHPYAAAATVSKRLFEHKTLKAIGPDIIYATVIANGAEQEQQQQHENDKERRDKDGYKQKSKSEKGLMMVRMMRDEDGKGLEDKVEVNTSAETKDLKSTEPLIDERSRSDVHDYGSSRGEVSEQKLLSNTDSGGLQAPFWVQCRGENATNDHRCERNTDSPSKLCGIHDPDVPKCSFETWEGDSCRNPRVLGELFGIHSPFVLKCSSKTQEGDDCRNLRTHVLTRSNARLLQEVPGYDAEIYRNREETDIASTIDSRRCTSFLPSH
ncbi:hypothetical protein BX616_004695 [Lobosporangium transversale]|uniref:Uncharacterized protein n=1 Tax=Lobosporangium transversale TaxID=64571 RepID=A0A1Y2GWW7_9FUNG|nr:hypothetical protein BCR41DRAFT_393377 [Lobosporangium transversale]KAF9916067.1 hypothetical protein BX616_004695 [Lobosporangium transversale]ORZ26767.1 hypothetical protein BCR41DRAFT_393377 [Lobosporangium transversale]|eukprot:XP_021884530.1 hypothetical protein BCR41DRAFT_393377 [Lobosporangium transversale]